MRELSSTSSQLCARPEPAHAYKVAIEHRPEARERLFPSGGDPPSPSRTFEVHKRVTRVESSQLSDHG
jgi:hypothetical protein